MDFRDFSHPRRDKYILSSFISIRITTAKQQKDKEDKKSKNIDGNTGKEIEEENNAICVEETTDDMVEESGMTQSMWGETKKSKGSNALCQLNI